MNYPLSIKGIKFSVLFLEKDKFVKISLRSRGEFPVNQLANKYFNGGGHKNASGGESELNLPDTLKKFEGLLPEYASMLK